MKKLIRYINIIFFIYSVTMLISYICVNSTLGLYKITMINADNDCLSILAEADVLNSNLNEVYSSRFINTDEVCQTQFPLISKVFKVYLKSNKSYLIKSIRLFWRNSRINLYPGAVSWYCTNCQIQESNEGLLINTYSGVSYLETRTINRLFPNVMYYSHLFLRYIPYTIVIGFLSLLVVFIYDFNKKYRYYYFGIIILWMALVYYFERFRGLFPPGKILSNIVSESIYYGKSVIGDYILVFTIVFLPLLDVFINSVISIFRKIYIKRK